MAIGRIGRIYPRGSRPGEDASAEDPTVPSSLKERPEVLPDSWLMLFQIIALAVTVAWALTVALW
jgi:hypothetical protein